MRPAASPENLRAKRRPRHFAISYYWVQGSPLPKEAVKNETHGGFHIQLGDPFPTTSDCRGSASAWIVWWVAMRLRRLRWLRRRRGGRGFLPRGLFRFFQCLLSLSFRISADVLSPVVATVAPDDAADPSRM